MSAQCEGFQEKLSALIDGELSAEMASAVERHLGECAACARVRSELEAVAETFRRLPVAKAPEGFAQSVAREVAVSPAAATAQKNIPFPGWRKYIEWTMAAAAVALIAVNVIYLMDYQKQENARQPADRMKESDDAAPEPSAAKDGRVVLEKKAPETGDHERAGRDSDKVSGKAGGDKDKEEREAYAKKSDRPVGKGAPSPDPSPGADGAVQKLAEAKPGDEQGGPQILERALPKAPIVDATPSPESPKPAAPAQPREEGKKDYETKDVDAEVITIAAADPAAAKTRIDAILKENGLPALAESRALTFAAMRAYEDGARDKKGKDGGESFVLACNESQIGALKSEFAKVGKMQASALGGARRGAEEKNRAEKPGGAPTTESAEESPRLRVAQSDGNRSEAKGIQEQFKKEEALREELKKMLKDAGPSDKEQLQGAPPALNAPREAPAKENDAQGIITGASPARRILVIRIVPE